MPFQDKNLTCADCGQPFVHSMADQERYAARGLTNDPKRCKACREKRRQQQGPKGGGKPGAPSGGGGATQEAPRERRVGRGRFFPASEPKRKIEFHPATCASCGKETTVPFKPVEGRPVYCRECFQQSKPRSKAAEDDFASGL